MNLRGVAKSLPFLSSRRALDAQQGARLTHWLMRLVEEGRPPVDSAWALAQRYTRDTNYPNERARLRALVRNEVGKSFSAGMLTGLGGTLALPVAVPAAAAASWLLQARLVAAMAYVMGHERGDPWVRAAVLVTLHDAREGTPMAPGAGHLGDWAARRVASYLAPRTLKLLERQVGRQLLGRQLKRSAARWMPVLGAVVAGSLDAHEAYAVAQRAWRLFATRSPALARADDVAKSADV